MLRDTGAVSSQLLDKILEPYTTEPMDIVTEAPKCIIGLPNGIMHLRMGSSAEEAVELSVPNGD